MKVKRYKKLVMGLAFTITMPLEITCVFAANKLTRVSLEQTQIDHHFLKKMEGSKLNGYVPLANNSKSGVTIANGFDLGQLNLKEFNNLSLDEKLKNKLRPYVGLRQHQAKTFLQRHPLTITIQELEQLNKAAAHKILHPLVQSYDRVSKTPFIHLPSEAQTVIFSYAYHFGPGFMKHNTSKQLWRHFVLQEWNHASRVLKNQKLYSSRRISEARLLDQLI